MVERFPPRPAPVKSEAANGGGLNGQTLQAWDWGETMGHEMDLTGQPDAGVSPSLSAHEPGRQAPPNSDHLSTIAKA